MIIKGMHMLSFFKFIFSRFNKKCYYYFLFSGLFVFVSRAISIIIPLIQKQIFNNIALKQLNNQVIIKFLFVGVLYSIISIVIAILSNKIFMEFKRIIQIELLESVTRSKNKLIEKKGSGAFLVSI